MGLQLRCLAQWVSSHAPLPPRWWAGVSHGLAQVLGRYLEHVWCLPMNFNLFLLSLFQSNRPSQTTRLEDCWWQKHPALRAMEHHVWWTASHSGSYLTIGVFQWCRENVCSFIRFILFIFGLRVHYSGYGCTFFSFFSLPVFLFLWRVWVKVGKKTRRPYSSTLLLTKHPLHGVPQGDQGSNPSPFTCTLPAELSPRLRQPRFCL